MSELDQPISLRNRIIAACVGSLATSLMVNPFDVVRVRMQQTSAVEHMSSGEPVSSEKSVIAHTNSANALKYGGSRLNGELRNTLASVSSSSRILRNPAFAAASASASESSARLGIDVCCRDTYWFPSNVTYCVASSADPCTLHKPKSTFSLLKTIASEEGVLTLWRGVGIMLTQAIPSNVVYYISYEHLRDQMAPITGASITPLAAGGIARMLASTIVSPLELIKTRLQSLQLPKGQNAMAVALQSVREMINVEGYRALWNGLGLTLWRDVPFSSIYWLVVEAMRAQFPRTDSHSRAFAQSFASGLAGGVFASVATTPFDVAKTRRQLAHPSCTSIHQSMLRFMRTIVQREGWSALFVGLAPRTFKVAPACAIMITSYDMGKRVLS